MMSSTKIAPQVYRGLNKELHGMLVKAGLMDEKRSIVRQFTASRTASSSEMSEQEMRHMIMWLKGKLKGGQVNNDQVSRNAMGRKIIHLLCKHSTYYQTSDGKPDMDKINELILEKWGKQKLWKLSNEEMRKIIGVIENRF